MHFSRFFRRLRLAHLRMWHYTRGSTEKLEAPSWFQEMDGLYSEMVIYYIYQHGRFLELAPTGPVHVARVCSETNSCRRAPPRNQISTKLGIQC